MSLISYETVCAILENDQYGITPYLGYSGRGMFGRKCFGFTSSEPGYVIGAISDAMNNTDDDVVKDECNELLHDICQDSLGLEVIVYFPNHNLSDEDCELVCDNFEVA